MTTELKAVITFFTVILYPGNILVVQTYCQLAVTSCLRSYKPLIAKSLEAVLGFAPFTTVFLGEIRSQLAHFNSDILRNLLLQVDRSGDDIFDSEYRRLFFVGDWIRITLRKLFFRSNYIITQYLVSYIAWFAHFSYVPQYHIGLTTLLCCFTSFPYIRSSSFTTVPFQFETYDESAPGSDEKNRKFIGNVGIGSEGYPGKEEILLRNMPQ